MSTEVVVAIFAFSGTLISGLVSNKLVTHRLEQLEIKVDKHNSVMERTFVLEEKVRNLEAR